MNQYNRLVPSYSAMEVYWLTLGRLHMLSLTYLAGYYEDKIEEINWFISTFVRKNKIEMNPVNMQVSIFRKLV